MEDVKGIHRLVQEQAKYMRCPGVRAPVKLPLGHLTTCFVAIGTQ